MSVENLIIEAACPIVEEGPIQIQTILNSNRKMDNIKYEVLIYKQISFLNSCDDPGKWKKLASANFNPWDLKEPPKINLHQFKANLTKRESVNDIYVSLVPAGFNFGPIFKSIKSIWSSPNDFLAETELPVENHKFVLHPLVIDAMIQALVFDLFLNDPNFDPSKLYLPVSIKKFVIFQKPQTLKLYIHFNCNNRNSPHLVIRLYDENGIQLCSMEGLELTSISKEDFSRSIDTRNSKYPDFYEEVWKKVLGPSIGRIDLSLIKCHSFEGTLRKIK